MAIKGEFSRVVSSLEAVLGDKEKAEAEAERFRSLTWEQKLDELDQTTKVVEVTTLVETAVIETPSDPIQEALDKAAEISQKAAAIILEDEAVLAMAS